MSDDDHCDRCGSLIVRDEWERPSPFQFVFSTDEGEPGEAPEYREETRILCSGCEDDLLEWIDEGDIDRSDCVDLPRTVEAADTIERTANTLHKTADVLRTELETEDEH